RDLHELNLAHEVIDRIDVAHVLIKHLLHRRETRWPGFTTNQDYPERDDEEWLKFVNTRLNPETGDVEIVERPYSQVVS
ncbi:MAG TPA: adenylylsulfate reductase, partial [Euryarchaeota archaeon]|nr:adenylylsulfate reductase [Euryarchaeota archaeon]